MLTLLLILISLSGFVTRPNQGYIPDDEIIFVITMSSQEKTVSVGTFINISIVITNYFKTDIDNITVIQSIPNGLEFYRTPAGPYDGIDTNYIMHNFKNEVNNEFVSANYINITASNFTLNFDVLKSGETIGLSYTVNSTMVGVSFIIQKPIVEYYDYWGDKYDVPQGSINGLVFEVTGIQTDPKSGYFPEISVEQNDYQLILIICITVVVIALLARILYMKKPIAI